MKLDFFNMKTIDELLVHSNVIKENGDLLLIKLDGEREENHYTAIISYSLKKVKDPIRREGSNLLKILAEVLSVYHKENNF